MVTFFMFSLPDTTASGMSLEDGKSGKYSQMLQWERSFASHVSFFLWKIMFFQLFYEVLAIMNDWVRNLTPVTFPKSPDIIKNRQGHKSTYLRDNHPWISCASMCLSSGGTVICQAAFVRICVHWIALQDGVTPGSYPCSSRRSYT